MKRVHLLLTVCLVAAGCGLFGSDGEKQCESGREGLFIQTNRDSYQVGERATLTVENCTGETLYLERYYSSPPDYRLEKRIAGGWKLASSRQVVDFRLVEVKLGDTYTFALPVEPYEDFVDSFAGTYRYELDIYDGQKVEDHLPKEERVSNTFEITE